MDSPLEREHSFLRRKYSLLIQRYNGLVQRFNRGQRSISRLRYNYQVVRRNYLILQRHASRKVTALVEQISHQKYQLVLDEYGSILRIPPEFLEEVEMTREEFSRSLYKDVLFEKFLPPPRRDRKETPVSPFRFPILLPGNAGDEQEGHPFVYFRISGKIIWHPKGRRFIYYLSLEDITSEVELEYFQKTDSLINHLTASNFQLLTAKKTIEMHKRMILSLTCSLIGEYSRETSLHLSNMEALTGHLTQECKARGILPPQDYDLDEYAKDIIYTSVLHDIGKMAVPRTILEKDGRLSPEEQNLIREHPRTGAGYISKIMEVLKEDPEYAAYCSFLRIPWEICLHHHERWDGSGYPLGLKGPDIPISARIVSIADTYEALRGSRKYNHSRCSHEEAVKIIRQEAGSQFDPAVVEAFLSVSHKFERTYREG